MGRDTAAAVGLAALLVEKEGEDSAFALLPADHVIENAERFSVGFVRCIRGSRSGRSLCNGWDKPSFPSTGYGYLQCGEAVEEYAVGP